MVDPISDMLTRVRNAVRAGHKTVAVPLSKIKLEIAKILKKEDYISDFSARHADSPRFAGEAGASAKRANKRFLEIDLKYPSKISKIKRISKPGQRLYVKADKIKQVRNGYGISVISTPKGLMTNKEAKKAGLGGEVLLEVW